MSDTTGLIIFFTLFGWVPVVTGVWLFKQILKIILEFKDNWGDE